MAYWGVQLGGTAASGLAGRTEEYGEHSKRESQGHSACSADGAKEDQALQEDLPGYRGYAQRVRYRLILGIY
ncbi:MAG: hypothetical protein KDH88_14085 [Chromatiales bacterium]|nr:hypothetical protein [Chromatiales bacterium]